MIPIQSLQTLENELDRIRTKSPDVADWNLNQIAAAKREVIERYGPTFSHQNIGELDRDTFLGFLLIKNNKHWSGLEWSGRAITKDMSRLREALALLVNESLPLNDRLHAIHPHDGKPMVSGLSRAIISPILQVVSPEKYGVVNGTTEAAMRVVGLWPVRSWPSLSTQYITINQILLEAAAQLGTDLWTLDTLWWSLTRPRSTSGDKTTRNGAVPAHGELTAAEASLRPKSDRESWVLELAGGLKFSDSDAYQRLMRFCREEFDYYDGIADKEPDQIKPIDVLSTISVNSFIDKAVQVRRIHRGIAAACDPLLATIPVDADLLTFDAWLRTFQQLLHAAVQVPEVLVPRAVKILHRKRPRFIPMLDTVVINYYLDAMGRTSLKDKTADKKQAATVATEVLKCFRDDLRHGLREILDLQSRLAEDGFNLTPVRILEILVWTETEPQGYYRNRKSSAPSPEGRGVGRTSTRS